MTFFCMPGLMAVPRIMGIWCWPTTSMQAMAHSLLKEPNTMKSALSSRISFFVCADHVGYRNARLSTPGIDGHHLEGAHFVSDLDPARFVDFIDGHLNAGQTFFSFKEPQGSWARQG